MSLKNDFLNDRIVIGRKAYKRSDLNMIINDYEGRGSYVLNPLKRGRYGYAITGVKKVYGFKTGSLMLDIGENRIITGVFTTPMEDIMPHIEELIKDCKEHKSWENLETSMIYNRYIIDDERYVLIMTPIKPTEPNMFLMVWY